MVALFVMLAGKTIHVNQDCSDCRTNSVCETDERDAGTRETDSKQESAVACPFGCDGHSKGSHSEGGHSERGHLKRGHLAHDHLAHGLPTDVPGEHSDPVHETHDCAVCSVLASAPDCPLVVGLPEWPDLVQPAVLAEICLPDVVEGREIRLRGPPLV